MILFLLIGQFTLLSNTNNQIDIQFQLDTPLKNLKTLSREYSTLVGIPPDGTVRMNYHIISQYDTIIGIQNMKNPPNIVEMSKPAFFREYRVVRISVHPLRYSGGKLNIYNVIDIKIDVKGGKGGGYIQDKGNKIFKNITINGSYALRWGKTPSKDSETPPWDGEGVKIYTGRRGVYKINYQSLKNAGFDPTNIDPRYLSIFYKGKEIPIYVKGEEDGQFNTSDYILFFADTLLGDSSYKYPYDTLNVYWLKLNTNKGMRIVSIPSEDVEGPPDTFYMDTLHFEIDTDTLYTRKFYPYHMWYWLRDTTYSIAFNLPYADTTSSLYLKWGFFNPDEDDKISLFVNQGEFNNLYVTPNNYSQVSITLPPPYTRNIVAGWNTVSLPESSAYFIYLDWLEVSYRSILRTDKGYNILFNGDVGPHKYKVGGFVSNNINIWRVDGYKITNFTTYQDSTGYGVIFGDNASSVPVYYIYVNGTELPPVSLKYCTSPTFLSENGADMLIITPEEFFPTANAYKEWKMGVDSLSISIITVDDIMNVFNYGISSPYAIKDFLKYAYDNYKVLYVLLFGKGTFDYRNIMGFSENKVPAILYKTTTNGDYYASDFYYACVSGNDEMPDIMVGRIPVVSEDDAEASVRKIQDYTSSLHMGRWRMKVFLGAGNFHLGNATTSSENLRNDYIPENMEIKRVYQRVSEPPDTTRWTEVMNTLNDGAILFNYIGHGGPGVLGYGRYLSTSDIPRLRNYNKLPFVSAFTCYNGEMDEPNKRSISEEFVVIPEVGAIGAFAPTGLTFPSNNDRLNRDLYKGIFKLGLRRLGDFTTYAKMLGVGGVNNYLYNLIGDPSVKLNIPEKNVEISLSPYTTAGGTLSINGKWDYDGTINFTILDSQDLEIASGYGDIISGNANVKVPLPDSIPPGQYKVLAYASNGSVDGIGNAAYFSVDGPGIQDIILNPENLGYGDTLNVYAVIEDTVPIDSAFFLYRFGTSSLFYRDSLSPINGDTFGLSSGIPITYENTTLEYFVEVWDALGRHTVSFKHHYRIPQRPDLRMGDYYPELILYKGKPSIKFEFLNDGDETIDSTLISFYYRDTTGVYTLFEQDTIRNIFPDTLYTIYVGCFKLIFQDTIQFKAVLDESLWVKESNESNNTITRYIPVNIFKLSKSQDTIATYQYPEGYFSVRFPPQPVLKDCYFQINEEDIISPENEPDIQGVYLNNKFRVFSIEFSDTTVVNTPYTITFYADTGNIYIWKSPKWIKVSSQKDSSGISASLSDKASPKYSIFTDTDTKKPHLKVEFVGAINDSIVLNNTLQISAVMEDENGIDLYVEKPSFMIDDQPVADPFNNTILKNYNLIPVKIDENIDEGTHKVEIYIRDVNGNTQTFEKTIEYYVPFEIQKIGNYPNPANKYTRFVYWITKPADEAKIEVYTSAGRKIYEANVPTETGRNEFYWNLEDNWHRRLGNGIYVYKFTLKKGNIIKVIKKLLAVLRR